MKNRKVVLYISMSLDGFIATKNDDISWLSIVEKKGEDYGYEDFNKTIDTYIVGNTTYEKILELTGGIFPQATDKTCYVITRKEKTNENGVLFYNGAMDTLINDLKKEVGKNIYCDGGSEIVKLLMDKNLIDEYRISIIPIILGDGKRLFKGGTPYQNLKLQQLKSYETGLVHLHYIKE